MNFRKSVKIMESLCLLVLWSQQPLPELVSSAKKEKII